MALDIVENCGEAYRNATDSTKKLMNQAIFVKFHINNTSDDGFSIKATFRAPFNNLLSPIQDDILKINKAMHNKSNDLENILNTVKGHIQDFLECGLSDVDNPSNMTTHSNNGYFFRHNSSSKELLVGLSETYSNNYSIIREYVKNYSPTPIKTPADPAITDLSYDLNSTVKTIKQQQKSLSETETRTIIAKYQAGASTYELAKEFGCHRYTISKALKDNGIEVTNQCARKKVLAEMIMQLYSEWYRPQEIGEALGVSADTVRRILHDNNVYIRRSWEYPKKK